MKNYFIFTFKDITTESDVIEMKKACNHLHLNK